ncbi:hypothetical protein SNEBB_005494 [Seison nebaliae]|nr:hypothetical protein SNEBB_005494 [Seison nebaliae]
MVKLTELIEKKLKFSQTNEEFTVELPFDDIPKNDLKIKCRTDQIEIINLGTEERKILKLWEEIDQSSVQIEKTEKEVKISGKKKSGGLWESLEKTNTEKATIKSMDYDKFNKMAKEIEKEEETETGEGDEALTKMFRKIYADGSDEQKKAILKSFSESGGTVLSTNWNEVKNDKVEVKPPDGMEYKEWEK